MTTLPLQYIKESMRISANLKILKVFWRLVKRTDIYRRKGVSPYTRHIG